MSRQPSHELPTDPQVETAAEPADSASDDTRKMRGGDEGGADQPLSHAVRSPDGTGEDPDGQEASTDQPLSYAVRSPDGTDEDPDGQEASTDQPLPYALPEKKR